MATVEAAGVGAQQPFHARDQVGPGGLDDEVEMVRHEAIGMDLPTGLDAGFAEGVEEPLPIEVVTENEFAMVTAVQDMVNRSWILDA